MGLAALVFNDDEKIVGHFERSSERPPKKYILKWACGPCASADGARSHKPETWQKVEDM